MRISRVWFCIIVMSAHAAAQDAPVRNQRERLAGMDYLLYLPAGYTPSRKWPLVLFLHGRGSGNSSVALQQAGPPANVRRGEDFPFILVSPRCPPGKWWNARELEPFLEAILQRYPIDEDRIYLTGLSMGGFGAWALGAAMPNRFAAIAPLCGGGDPAKAGLLKNTPIRAFHGASDHVVPLQRSQDMVDAIKAQGGDVELTIFPQAAHVIWPQVYDDPEFWRWLLRQKRISPASQPEKTGRRKNLHGKYKVG